MTDFGGAYSGRRVLVTGHTGFKGSWLAAWLSRLDASVTGFALAPATEPSLFEIAGLSRRIRSVTGDIRDLDHLERTWREARPEVVFHLAAQPIVRQSYRDPLETIGTNVIGTTHVLEVARRERRPVAIVVVTSDKCYENREWIFGYREDDRLGGRDPYSASKAAAEILTSSYRRSFFPVEQLDVHGVSVATTRAGNVIGGGDWAPDRIIPDSIRALSQGQSVGVRNARATRPWQHVLEPLSGYLMLGARMLGNGAARAEACDCWNFGPDDGSARTVGELVDRVIVRYGRGAWHDEGTPGPHENGLLRLSTDKARLRLGWRPRWSFCETVDATVDWYKAFESGESMSEWCDRQIDQWSNS